MSHPEDNLRPDRDRRVRQADRLARILSVLRLIQGRGQWHPKTIAHELEVSELTVYRDLEVLKFAAVPFYRARGRETPDCCRDERLRSSCES